MRNYANTAVETQLAGAIDASATSLEVVQGAGYPDGNFAIVIDAEVILVGTRTGNVFSDLQRGYDGTVATSHVAGSWVSHTAIADDYRQIWNVPEHDHDVATSSTAGFMSAADKEKLDSIEAGATADQSAAEVPYSNAVSGLVSTDVQNAIDEIKGLIDEGGGGDASEALMLSNDALISLRLWQLQAAVIGQREGIEGFHGEGFFIADDQVESVTDGMVVRGALEGEGYASNELIDQSVRTKLPNPEVLPAGNGLSCEFSPDGMYLAVGHATSPFITIYRRSGDTFTKLPDPAGMPADTVNDCAFSSDGVYLAVAVNSGLTAIVYKRSGNIFTKLPDLAGAPLASYSCAFSPDGVYLAFVGAGTNAHFAIYKRAGDAFTKLANPVALPTGQCNGCAFSPDGMYLAVAHGTSPYLTIYRRDGDVFTKLANPSVLPGNTGRACEFSPDGLYLAVGHSGTNSLKIYKREGDTFTKLADPDVMPPSNSFAVAFSPDGKLLFVGSSTAPYLTIYERNGDTFSKIDNPVDTPVGNVRDLAVSPGGQYLAVAHTDTPYLIIYKTGSTANLETTVQLVEKTLPYTADSVLVIDSFEGDAGSSRQYQVSLNGGTTWETVTAEEVGTIKQLGHSGSNMKVRLVIESDGVAVGKCFYFVVYAKEVE